ncbi:unnamed protein product [Nesidiocoris tenuis]|uniref:Uncharacterized protein n=1 Tax=Nesidiocoris tenuis TaxID=355587 RepID=A0A6H5HQ87_9HEMI|nr:unnamed protein product [Nesidiocoris tenuis]
MASSTASKISPMEATGSTLVPTVLSNAADTIQSPLFDIQDTKVSVQMREDGPLVRLTSVSTSAMRRPASALLLWISMSTELSTWTSLTCDRISEGKFVSEVIVSCQRASNSVRRNHVQNESKCKFRTSLLPDNRKCPGHALPLPRRSVKYRRESENLLREAREEPQLRWLAYQERRRRR